MWQVVKEGLRCFDTPLDTTAQNVGVQSDGGHYALGLGLGGEGRGASRQAPFAQTGGQLQGWADTGHAFSHQGQHFPQGGGFHEGHLPDEEQGLLREGFHFGEHNSAPVGTPILDDWIGDEPPPPPPPPRPCGAQVQTRQEPPPQLPRNASVQQMQSRQMHSEAVPTLSKDDQMERTLWKQGSVIEIFSASAERWYPALLLRTQKGENGMPDVVTLQFWLRTDEAKQKSLYINDGQHLAPLGTHLGNELPPGFCLKPSQSRPGQSVFMDMTTGTKYQTAELAWQTYFRRLLERPASGVETVCNLPNAQSMAVSLQQRPPGSHQGAPMERGKSMEQQDRALHRGKSMDQDRAMHRGRSMDQKTKEAAGLVTEHEAEMPVHKEAKGVVTEYMPCQQQRGITSPRQRRASFPQQQQPQQVSQMQSHQRGPEYPPQQSTAFNDQRHGALLAAELRTTTQQQQLHQHIGRSDGSQAMDCRSAIRA
jgi:hypothetical protein